MPVYRLSAVSRSVLLALSCIMASVAAQNQTAPVAPLQPFGQPVAVSGAMERFDQDFADGLAIDLYSPKNRTLVVNQNMNPLSAQFVTGTTGEPYIALQTYSYVIQMNETADDLIAKIEVPYDPLRLAGMGVQESNTYVGKLSDDKQSWTVDESTRNVHRSENNTRIIRMTSIAGEYRLLGRQTIDTANVFVQYGQGATRTVNITEGGRQEAVFVDGLRFSMVSPTKMTMNVDIRNGIPEGTLAKGMVAVNSFVWIVNTSDPNAVLSASMTFPEKIEIRNSTNAPLLPPVNAKMIASLPQSRADGAAIGETKLVIAKRALNAPPTTPFAMTTEKVELEDVVGRAISGTGTSGGADAGGIVVGGMQQVDGEYVLVVVPAAPPAASSPAPVLSNTSRRRRSRRRII
ncbi:uncharacterized protein RSE6_09027 [Rhynchosporium secalis]|uniref:Uncharacterized protein n=1 Tax=Rhynchosporium secalis TaxID=38038 RepID=A0A1E1MGY4_RHYSE|nr:uncharacterized protein RSE6_09027 [Rhynchosporium secalis]